MTTERRFDSDLPRILGDIAAGPYPDYIDDVLSTTAQRRQRPAWTFPERWFPMETVATAQVPTARLPWRALGIIALLAALLVGALLIGTGARPNPAPAFGLAENGKLAIVVDGDIRAVDQATGEATDLIAGPDDDAQPTYSLDGRRLAFVRRVDETSSHVLVVAAEGGETTTVTPGPLADVGTIRFTPAADQVLIEASREGVPSLAFVGIDGTGFRWLDIDGPAERAAFLPDGAAIIHVTGGVDGAGQGLARFDIATARSTELVAGVPNSVIVGTPSISPDGAAFAFGLWVNSGNASTNARTYTMPVDGGATHSQIPAPLTICCQANPAWSNDGTRIASQRIYDGHQVVAIYDAKAGGTGVEFLAPSNVPDITVAWSPDDRYVLATYWSDYASETDDATELEHVVIDSTTGSLIDVTWDNAGPASWQRVGR